MTFSRPAPRIGSNFNIVNGEFFLYLHDFDDPDLIKELANLGCWTAVDPKNYESNCLLLAFQSAGVPDKVLQAMKHDFLQRKISRKNIKLIHRDLATRPVLRGLTPPLLRCLICNQRKWPGLWWGTTHVYMCTCARAVCRCVGRALDTPRAHQM